MRIALASIILFHGLAAAAPFLVSDPYTGASLPTHCGILLDTAAKVEVPAVIDPSGAICKYDLASAPTGAHVVKARFILRDPVWGVIESADSAPLNFLRPGAPTAPLGLSIKP